MHIGRMAVGFVFLAVGAAGSAGAAELKVLSVDTMKPALQELAPAFETASKDKLKIDYASADAVEKKIDSEEEYDVVIVDHAITGKLIGKAKLAGGLVKWVAKKSPDLVYDASTTNFSSQPLAAADLINFLATPKAAEVYKAKGLQPG